MSYLPQAFAKSCPKPFFCPKSREALLSDLLISLRQLWASLTLFSIPTTIVKCVWDFTIKCESFLNQRQRNNYLDTCYNSRKSLLKMTAQGYYNREGTSPLNAAFYKKRSAKTQTGDLDLWVTYIKGGRVKNRGPRVSFEPSSTDDPSTPFPVLCLFLNSPVGTSLAVQ